MTSCKVMQWLFEPQLDSLGCKRWQHANECQGHLPGPSRCSSPMPGFLSTKLYNLLPQCVHASSMQRRNANRSLLLGLAMGKSSHLSVCSRQQACSCRLAGLRRMGHGMPTQVLDPLRDHLLQHLPLESLVQLRATNRALCIMVDTGM